jgi:hypothetical protein
MEKPSMIGFSRTIAQVIFGFSIALFATAQAPTSAGAATKPVPDEATLRAFAAIHPIDVHVHVFKTDPTFQKMLERLNLKLLNILVMDDTNPHRKQLQPEIDDALALVRRSRSHVALCTRLKARHSLPTPSSRSTATSSRGPWRSRSGKTSEWKSRTVAANMSWPMI